MKTHPEVLEDTNKLAEIVFARSTTVTVEDGKIKLDKIIAYYTEKLKATASAASKQKGSYCTALFY